MFGIADLSIVPIRREQSERSEMVSQILFGELFEILETTDKWAYIRLLHDRYEGWIDKKCTRKQIRSMQPNTNPTPRY